MSDKLGKYTVVETGDNLLISGQSINERKVAAPAADPLIINGAWYLEALPNMIVAELADSSLAMFFLTPFRAIAEKDMRPYKSYHPRKCKGQPLPDYLYRFYGLAKNAESATETIHVRVSPTEKAKIETYGANLEPKKGVSELVRDYIRSLA